MNTRLTASWKAFLLIPGRSPSPLPHSSRRRQRAADRRPRRLARSRRGIGGRSSDGAAGHARDPVSELECRVSAQADDPGRLKKASDPSTATDPLTSTYGGWEAVTNAGLALSEATTLLELPRSCSTASPRRSSGPHLETGDDAAARSRTGQPTAAAGTGEEPGPGAGRRRQDHDGLLDLPRPVPRKDAALLTIAAPLMKTSGSLHQHGRRHRPIISASETERI